MWICSAVSPTTSTEATTEFCVIHIEDDEQGQSTSEPAESPVRTMAKPVHADSSTKVISTSKTISLPGIPDMDDAFENSSDPQASWCSSSVSSEISVKSTDALMGKN